MRRFGVMAMVSLTVLLFAAIAGLPAVASAAADPTTPVSAQSSLDRPAIWVADRVTFTIHVTCASGYDILTDDLARDKLTLAPGLDLLSSDVEREARGDQTLYTARYVLT